MAEVQATERKRTGEKAGWTGGWLGAFIWVPILAIVIIVRGRMIDGILGLGLFVSAVGAILSLAPWRHPTVPYWRLMLPLYLGFFVSIAWAVWSFYNPYEPGLKWWSFFWILPCLTPLFTIGARRWGVEDIKSKGNKVL